MVPQLHGQFITLSVQRIDFVFRIGYGLTATLHGKLTLLDYRAADNMVNGLRHKQNEAAPFLPGCCDCSLL